MLQTKRVKVEEKVEVKKRWENTKKKFPNGKESYWIGWKLYPDDAVFEARHKAMFINFSKSMNVVHDNIELLSEWKVTRKSYESHLPTLAEELNFFLNMYDKDHECLASLFRIKIMIDIDHYSYTEENFPAFIEFVYNTLFTDSILEKIKYMVEENYVDDIEQMYTLPYTSPQMMTFLQMKRRSLEFKNEHVKGMIKISFAIKFLSFIINHFIVIREMSIKEKGHLVYDFYKEAFKLWETKYDSEGNVIKQGDDFSVFNKTYAYIENKVNSTYNLHKMIYESRQIEGDDKSIVINRIFTKNVIVDGFVKFALPRTWVSEKQAPRERILSFLSSIANNHISLFSIQVFKRNYITTGNPLTDGDDGSRNDKYRISKMKINEGSILISTYAMKGIVKDIFSKYNDIITPEEIDYYRKNLKPSRLHQMMIEIYFFNYLDSSAEFTLLRDEDFYKLLLVMRYDIMKRLGATKSTMIDNPLVMICTSNIEENPLGEKLYVKDSRFLKENEMYILLMEKYYSVIADINPELVKKFLLGFVNSNYKMVLYEYQHLKDSELYLNKRELINEILNFLILANTNFSISEMLKFDKTFKG